MCTSKSGQLEQNLLSPPSPPLVLSWPLGGPCSLCSTALAARRSPSVDDLSHFCLLCPQMLLNVTSCGANATPCTVIEEPEAVVSNILQRFRRE